MLIHQLLGTRISDALTLQRDCLFQKDGHYFIRIDQMKTNTYEKPISGELSSLIQKAIDYSRERYGENSYIFVSDNDKSRPLQYGTLRHRILVMIHKEDLRDDSGELFGFGSHIFRHCYGMKLSEMHLDDWTIARLLGHNNLKNVSYYRKMSSQVMDEETQRVRDRMDEILLQNLENWGKEYEQIRQNAGDKQTGK